MYFGKKPLRVTTAVDSQKRHTEPEKISRSIRRARSVEWSSTSGLLNGLPDNWQLVYVIGSISVREHETSRLPDSWRRGAARGWGVYMKRDDVRRVTDARTRPAVPVPHGYRCATGQSRWLLIRRRPVSYRWPSIVTERQSIDCAINITRLESVSNTALNNYKRS